jgi:hypothetical protein
MKEPCTRRERLQWYFGNDMVQMTLNVKLPLLLVVLRLPKIGSEKPCPLEVLRDAGALLWKMCRVLYSGVPPRLNVPNDRLP